MNVKSEALVCFAVVGLAVAGTLANPGEAVDPKLIAELETQIESHLLPGLIRSQLAIPLDEHYFLSGFAKQPGVSRFLYVNGSQQIRWDIDPTKIYKPTQELSNPPSKASVKLEGSTVKLVMPFITAGKLVGVISLSLDRQALSALVTYSKSFSMDTLRSQWQKERNENSAAHYQAGKAFAERNEREKAIPELEMSLRIDSTNTRARELLKKLGKEYQDPRPAPGAD